MIRVGDIVAYEICVAGQWHRNPDLMMVLRVEPSPVLDPPPGAVWLEMTRLGCENIPLGQRGSCRMSTPCVAPDGMTALHGRALRQRWVVVDREPAQVGLFEGVAA